MTAEIRARWVITHRAPCILVRGKDVRDMLRRYGFKPLWSVAGRGWVLDDTRLEDVAAIAGIKTLGYRVVHPDGTNCECSNVRAEGRQEPADPSEPLCGCELAFDETALLIAEELGGVDVAHAHRSAS